eukprot:Skav201339  [mRNA]  locus=scaffold1389:257315:257599:+ [translate_table: standard]
MSPEWFVKHPLLRNACISASADCERALDLLASFGSKSLEADVISYNSAIATCEKVAQWPTAANICLTAFCSVLVCLSFCFFHNCSKPVFMEISS